MACRDKDAPGIMLRPAKETVHFLTIILAALERFAYPVQKFISDHF
jgi:hypothetical protein